MEIRPTALRGDGHSRDSSFQNFYINPLSEPRLASRILYGIERCRSDSRKPGPIFDPCIERGSRQSVTIAVRVGHRVSNMGIGQIAVVLRPQLDERWHSERLPVADTGMTADQTIAARIASAARRITSGVAGASSSGTRPGAMLASAWVMTGNTEVASIDGGSSAAARQCRCNSLTPAATMRPKAACRRHGAGRVRDAFPRRC